MTNEDFQRIRHIDIRELAVIFAENGADNHGIMARHYRIHHEIITRLYKAMLDRLYNMGEIPTPKPDKFINEEEEYLWNLATAYRRVKSVYK